MNLTKDVYSGEISYFKVVDSINDEVVGEISIDENMCSETLNDLKDMDILNDFNLLTEGKKILVLNTITVFLHFRGKGYFKKIMDCVHNNFISSGAQISLIEVYPIECDSIKTTELFKEQNKLIEMYKSIGYKLFCKISSCSILPRVLMYKEL